jgi:redox-sensitive bicupin YhaK (pirin superfamily)
MIIRRATERGYADHGWLRSYHTFSFANYHDPRFMGFRVLRVINDDRVAAGRGFGTHSHRDMEIISYVLEGELAHRDSMGTGSVIRPGDVQRMTAGTGVSHSEMNPSSTTGVHFLQIWIVPEKNGLTPSYEQKAFPVDERAGKLRLVASPDGAEGSVTVHQNIRLFAALLDRDQAVTCTIGARRYAWVHVAEGSVEIEGTVLSAGDAAAFGTPGDFTIRGVDAGHVLVFDLP